VPIIRKDPVHRKLRPFDIRTTFLITVLVVIAVCLLGFTYLKEKTQIHTDAIMVYYDMLDTILFQQNCEWYPSDYDAEDKDAYYISSKEKLEKYGKNLPDGQIKVSIYKQKYAIIVMVKRRILWGILSIDGKYPG
jgi:hypothetical protein